MKFGAFKNMWERDGFQMVKHEERIRHGHKWVLVTVLSNEQTYEYGRHFGITLALDKNDEVVAHDITNLRNSTNPTRDTMEWFNRNVDAGL